MSSVCGLSLNEVNHRTLQRLCSVVFCFACSEKDDYQTRANVKTRERCVTIGLFLWAVDKLSQNTWEQSRGFV